MSAGATDKIALPNDRRLRPKSAKQPHVGKILLFFVCFLLARTYFVFAAGWENGKQCTCRTVTASTIGFVVDVTHPQATVSAQAPAFFSFCFAFSATAKRGAQPLIVRLKAGKA